MLNFKLQMIPNSFIVIAMRDAPRADCVKFSVGYVFFSSWYSQNVMNKLIKPDIIPHSHRGNIFVLYCCLCTTSRMAPSESIIWIGREGIHRLIHICVMSHSH